MKKKILITLIIVLAAILAAELIFVGIMHFTAGSGNNPQLSVPDGSTEGSAGETETSEETTEASTEASTEESTAESTEETEPSETEPTEQRYVLTFVGDCTFGSAPSHYNSSAGFVKTVGEDYEYPFRNVAEYFRNDDFTMINFEGVLADSGYAANKTFTFRGPTAFVQILPLNSIEAVTLANNHSKDYGQEGYDSTKSVLESVEVTYVEQNGTALYTTESGLTIGLYAAAFNISVSDMSSDIAALRDQGAEIVVCAMHWGTEGSYRPSADQEKYAKAAIDAGADIVYGHHPHVLQKVETYKDGIIYYSLGNFSFGGNHFPRDMDTAVLQQEIIRDESGRLSLGELTIIPCSMSAMSGQNNFQPTPYEEGSTEYLRVLSKLNGTYNGPNLYVDYTDPTEPTDPTDPAETTPGETTGETGETTGGESGETTGGESGDNTGTGSGEETGGDPGSSGTGSGESEGGGDVTPDPVPDPAPEPTPAPTPDPGPGEEG